MKGHHDRRWSIAAGIVVTAANLWILGVWSRPVAALAAVRTCARAVVYDGVLACDDEIPRSADALCGGTPGGATLRAGDRVRCDAKRAVEVTRMAGDALATLEQPVDVNSAAEQELQSLRGIGPALAGRIVEARPFEHVDDLVRVRGIGPKTLNRIRPRIRVESSGLRPRK